MAEAAGLFKHYWKKWTSYLLPRHGDRTAPLRQGASVRPCWHRRSGALQWHQTASPPVCGSQDMEDEIFMVVCAGEGKGQRWYKKLRNCLLLLAPLNRPHLLHHSQQSTQTRIKHNHLHTQMQTRYLLGLQSSWPWHGEDLTPCKGLDHEHRAWIVPVPASAKYVKRVKTMAVEVQEYLLSHQSSITLSSCSY